MLSYALSFEATPSSGRAKRERMSVPDKCAAHQTAEILRRVRVVEPGLRLLVEVQARINGGVAPLSGEREISSRAICSPS